MTNDEGMKNPEARSHSSSGVGVRGGVRASVLVTKLQLRNGRARSSASPTRLARRSRTSRAGCSRVGAWEQGEKSPAGSGQVIVPLRRALHVRNEGAGRLSSCWVGDVRTSAVAARWVSRESEDAFLPGFRGIVNPGTGPAGAPCWSTSLTFSTSALAGRDSRFLV